MPQVSSRASSRICWRTVWAAAGSREAVPDHPALLSARELFREAVPRARPTERALAHHTHLLRAAAAIGVALKEADGSLNVDRILTPLRSGYAQLELAADSLPGFEKISYEHACCGLRAK